MLVRGGNRLLAKEELRVQDKVSPRTCLATDAQLLPQPLLGLWRCAVGSLPRTTARFIRSKGCYA